MTIEHKRSSKGEIEDLIRARYSLIWITSPEENRVEEALKRLCVEREKSISAVLDWDLPNRAEIEAAARKVVPSLPPATQQLIESDPTFMERVVEGALGLTLVEAENVFAKSAVRTHTFDLETILEEKKQIIRKSGLLEYYEHREEFSDVGGMEVLKD